MVRKVFLGISLACLLAACGHGRDVALEARVQQLESQLQDVRGKLEAANAEVQGLQSALDSMDGALADLGGARSSRTAQELASAYGAMQEAVDGVDGAVQDALASIEEEDAAGGQLIKTSRRKPGPAPRVIHLSY